ncbi:hypothetical protein A4X13_0g1514 [Tilletia indica]|uniref:Sin1 middle CRIM domain-containing protein n=1 Tax=Tilletia indica TaxID=43049 RepID=A0A8T8TD07_9BASI|nr:hypothetical protein A4X13_0g1514 [Tilletia indica]
MSLLADADWVTHSLRVGYLRYVDDHYARQVIEFPFESSDGLDLKSADGIGEPHFPYDRAYTSAPTTSEARAAAQATAGIQGANPQQQQGGLPPSFALLPSAQSTTSAQAGPSGPSNVELPRTDGAQQQQIQQQQQQAFTQADLLQPRSRSRTHSRSRPSDLSFTPTQMSGSTAVDPSVVAAPTTSQLPNKGKEVSGSKPAPGKLSSRTETELPAPLTFEKLSVQEIRTRSIAQRPQVSAIAATLQAQSESASNPFAALYRDVCGKNASETTPAPVALAPAVSRPRHGPGSAVMASRSIGPMGMRGRGPAGGAGGPGGAGGRAGGPSRVEVYFPFADRSTNTAEAAAAASSSSATAPDPSSSRLGPVRLNPKAGSMTLSIRTDAKMEEVIGYALYCYVDAKWSPALVEVPDWAQGDQDEIKLTTLGYCLRIVEDGEVDDDFPALDRSLVVGKFGGDEFAVCQASAKQVKENEVTSAPFRASRQAALADSLKAMSKAKAAASSETSSDLLTVGPAPNGSSMSSNMTALTAGKLSSTTGGPINSAGSVPGSTNVPGATGSSAATSTSTIVQQGGGGGAGGNGLSTSLNPAASGAGGATQLNVIASSSAALSTSASASRSYMAAGLGGGQLEASVFLRVLHTPKPNVHVKIMIQVPAQMYFADVLDLICRKVQEGKSAEWALVAHYGDQDVVVPLNRTVESLDEACDLKLVRRDSLAERGAVGRLTAPGGNPNTSIFAGRNKSSKQDFANAMDMSAYKSWKVIRAARSARMFSKPERLLTLDGEWIWIEPSDPRHFSARPTSFHISSVIACKQSTKGGPLFKLVVRRLPSVVEPTLGGGAVVPAASVGRDTKRFDLEAESADDAEEIVREIHKVMNRRRESGTELAS